MAATTPEVYDFGDWDDFCAAALQFHESTRPEDQLVVQRIETFRNYMSSKVLEYLGCFVHLHPRFYSLEGWDHWVQDVSQALRLRKELWNKHAFSEVAGVEDAIKAYKKGRATARGFWQALDQIVVSGELSSEEQRKVFWDSLTAKEQQRFATQCSYASPQHEVWKKEGSVAYREAEQELSRIIEFSVLHEQLQNCFYFLIGIGLCFSKGFFEFAWLTIQLMLSMNLSAQVVGGICGHTIVLLIEAWVEMRLYRRHSALKSLEKEVCVRGNC